MPDEAPVVLKNPYGEGFTWLRGNLHTHTTRSDGARSPEAVIADYEGRKYDFLSISDHDVLVDPADYQAGTSMTLIPGVEITANGPHILHVNVTARVAPDPDRQHVLDEAARQPESFTVLNHPNWQTHYNHFPQELMERLTGSMGVEVYNGVIDRLEGSSLASDRWDRLLSIGKTAWGFGHDDSHDVQDVEIAWNVVQSSSRSAADIVAGLKAGRFYASTGVGIQSIRVHDRTIVVVTSNAQRIRFISRWGVIRSTVEDQAAEYTLPERPKDALALQYIRVECYGAGGRIAWAQPLWITAGS